MIYKSNYNLKSNEYIENQEIDKPSPMLFENLEWVRCDEAAFILRMSVGAIRTAVCRGQIKATTFRRRLYFNRKYLNTLLVSSPSKGGF
jgi:hypothetical protein